MTVQHESTRRGMLATLAAIPAVAAVPALAALPARSADTAAWDAAYRRWQAADAGAHPYGDDVERDAETEAWRQLTMLPAPHGEALLWKLDYLFGQDSADGYADGWSMEIINVVVADAHRLLGHTD